MANWKAEAWVTSVLKNELVPNALILATSLRRSRTTREITVIISTQLSPSNCSILQQAFDMVFVMKETTFANHDTLGEAHAKAFAFGLTPYRKCVYVSANSFFLENADSLFDVSDGFQSRINPTNGMLDLSVFVLKPQKRVWNMLCSIKTDFSEDYLSAWIKNQREFSKLGLIKEEIISDFCVGNGNLLSEATHLQIIHFVNFDEDGQVKMYQQMKNLQKLNMIGLHEKLIVESWLSLYDEVTLHCWSTPNRELMSSIIYETCYNEPIAIVGMSCRYPNANSLEQFWNLLYNGEEGICEPPAFRWIKEHSLRVNQYDRKTRAGFLSVPVDEFDARFFGISPKEAAYMDPQARILHEVLWESLEDAGIDPLRLYGSHTGIFTGSWTNEYRDIIQCSAEKDFFRTYMGNSMGTTAARLSFLLGLTGRSIATESGCSSAIVALDLAIKSLRVGQTNLALAGGVNLMLHPFDSSMLEYVISPQGRCKTFDANADGFARAEGCGVLVLKRLSDALRDQDKIWAMIRGSAVAQEGLSRSLGTPTVHCEALAMQLALEDAGVSPEQVSFVETHGTGTQVGDPMEVAAIQKAYHSPNRKEPLVIGSVKTNVGHTESCSGITGIMKAVLALQHELIPKHRNLETINPKLCLNAIPAIIPLENLPWKKINGEPRICGVSSFGLTGTDGHVIIEEAPDYILPKFSLGLERSLHLMKISGKSSQALEELLKEYQTRFSQEKFKDANFADVAYSANTGRADFNHRAVILASNGEHALRVLNQKKYMEGDISSSKASQICFLFTGQGSQYQGMAKLFYETSPVFRMAFDRCDRILRETYNLSIRQVLWESEEDSKELSRTIYSQTSIFCIEYCLLKLWESWGIKPDFVLGHSLGEFCAAVAAGVLQFEDALKLVAERSHLIDKLPRGSMLVVKASKPEVEKWMQAAKIDLDFAAVNSPEQTVVAGDSDVVENFLAYLKARDTKAIILEATHAFHSRHMDPMLEGYRKVAQSIKYKPGNPNIQYISGMEGRIIDDISELGADYWIRHTREKVSFIDACAALQDSGVQHFIEIGPQPVLSSFVISNNEGTPLNCFPSLRRGTNDWETILTSLGKLYLLGYQVDWKGFDRPYIRKKVSLPFHPFHRKPLWVECHVEQPALIHPLLGYHFKNASSSNIFQNDLTLKSIPYLKDHCIGNRTIFPGAAFTEMCLSAGYSVANGLFENFEQPSRAMKLENLKIEAPLELHEGKVCRLQVTVDIPQNSCDSSFRVQVYHQNSRNKNENSGKWLLHASSTFIPVASTRDCMKLWNAIRISEIISTIQPVTTDHFYRKVKEQGMHFGDQFRTLQRYWPITTENPLEVVTEIQVPTKSSQYLLHPLIVDAIFQTDSLLSSYTKLQVPVHIAELVFIQSLPENATKLYLHMWTAQHDKRVVFIATENWIPVTFASDFIMVETNMRTIESVLELQNSAVPDAWEESWKVIPSNFSTSEEKREEIERVSEKGFTSVTIDTDETMQMEPLNAQRAITGQNEKTARWVVFGDGNNLEVVSKVVYGLEASGFGVEVIWREDRVPDEEDAGRSLKEDIESKVIKMDSANEIKAVLEEGAFEGIVYAWGMDMDELDQRKIALPFMNVCKALVQMSKLPQLLLVTRDVHLLNEDSAFVNPNAATLWGMVKSLKNETDMILRCVDFEGKEEDGKLAEQILIELGLMKEMKEQHRVQVAYRGGLIYEPRFVKATFPTSGDLLKLPPSTERYHLKLPESRAIQDLGFEPLEVEPVGEDEIEVKTKAFSLNFKDILTIIKPSAEFEKLNAVGLDFAGVVVKAGPRAKWKVGQKVFGANFKGGQLPSHFVIDSNAVVAIPNGMTYEEAATLPTVFLTAYHCLINVAKMKKGDKVLIHTGSGGVGLAAIQVAKMVGAEIITTAGNQRKRAYLKSLGIQHVFHSRDTSFEHDILRVTNGQGVDVVLNSITGPGIKEATLRCTAKNGRFVEMSKLCIWTPEEVSALRQDVDYNIVDLTTLDHETYSNLLAHLKKLLSQGDLKPIPFVKFDALYIRQALQYFQKAKHIGKVVCSMPEVNIHQVQYKTEVQLFNNESTYLITGGLGGIGFEVCKWMLGLGATDIMLAGRSPPKPEVAKEIQKLKEKGYNVMIGLGDVGDYDHCQKLVTEITEKMKPLRGIMHCAGVLRDNLYANQTWNDFEATYNPKIKGTWNLHQLTQNCPLEHFVVYSSITALMGTPGQPNHSSANCYEDALIHYRHSLGLPGTTINWGQWAQVGCAKEVNLSGILPVSMQRMLNGLEVTLRSNKRQVCFSEFDSFTKFSMLCPMFKNYLDERLWKQDNNMGQTAQGLVKADQFWKEMEAANTKEEKTEVMVTHIKAILKQALRLEPDEPVSEHGNLQELGVDSLVLIELRNSIQTLLGSRLVVTADIVKNCNTIYLLAVAVVGRLIDEEEDEEINNEPLSREEFLDLLKKDSVLDENIQVSSKAQQPVECNQIKNILVTGATGKLAPYIVAKLSKMPSVDKLYCLIQGDQVVNIWNEVLSTLELESEVVSEKVECLAGNVTKEYLGLTQEQYKMLCKSVDAVIQCAAKTNQNEYYKPGTRKLTDSRSVNVGGTLNVLRFACAEKIKHVYFPSTLLLGFFDKNVTTELSDSWPEPEMIETMVNYWFPALQTSKCICEMLLKQANQRGIPCKVFRFPWIAGESKTGRVKGLDGIYILRYLGFLKTGAMPDTVIPTNVLPVDICAEMSLQIFMTEKAPNEVFNVGHPQPQVEQEFVRVAEQEFGIKLEILESSEYTERLKQSMKLSRNEALNNLYSNQNQVTMDVSDAAKHLTGYLCSPDTFFRNAKITSLIKDYDKVFPTTMEIVCRDLGYLKQKGMLKELGIL